MNILMRIAIALGFGIFYGLWRRCYGGWDTPIWKKVFGDKIGSVLHRNFWRIINMASIFCMSYFYLGMSWIWALYSCLIMQFVLWDWTFGMYMGIGRHGYPSEEDIEEYNSQLFAPLLNWLIEEKNRYGEYYDYLGMMFRFSAPGLLLFFVPSLDLGMCFLGTLIATGYLMEFRFAETGYDSFLTRNFSELFAGFASGLLFVM